MDNVGFGEVMVILLVGLVVLGPTKLPHAARQVARFINEVRQMGMSFKQEFYDVVNEPIQEVKNTLAVNDAYDIDTYDTDLYDIDTHDTDTHDMPLQEQTPPQA